MKSIPHTQSTLAYDSKVCSRCHELKPLSEYGKDRSRKDGLCYECVACRNKLANQRRQANLAAYRETEKKWSAANQERVKATQTRWLVTHRDDVLVISHKHRAQKAGTGGTYTVQEWKELKARYDNRCLCCYRPEGEVVISIDHIVPIDKGGTNYIDNIQPLCLSCNFRKRLKHICYRPDKLLPSHTVSNQQSARK